MKFFRVQAFSGLRPVLFCAQRRHLTTNNGASEALNNSSDLQSRISRILECKDLNSKNDENHSTGAQKKPNSRHKARRNHNKGTRMHGPAQSPNTKEQKNHKPEQEPNSDTKSPLPSQYITQLKGSVRPNQEELKQIHKPRGESIPKLAHKLDRVLFSPGVHFLQDPRTRVYNFNPYLKQIVSHEDFDFEKVQKFVSASKDATLLREAKAQNKKFYSSTSSMTSTLHQFYLFLNNYTPSEDSKYRFDFPNFSRTARDLPSAVIVEPKGVNEANGETIYSVTSDKSTDVEILLSAMGHCLEALLTTEEEEFKELLIKRDGDEKDEKKVSVPESTSPELKDEPLPASTAETAENVYNYSGYGDFLMRSQLDCYDSRLPGNGTFDLKTRAAASVRYDKASEAADSSYQIWKLKGNVESFQREFEDLIRTGGLLKYGFQARIGQMDGIFVAYHNINSFFGFQYLPLSEIDKVFYSNTRFDEKIETHGAAKDIEQDGNMASLFAEAQFKASIRIWQDVMKTVERDFKGTEYEGSAFRLVTNRVSRVRNKKQMNSPAHDKRENPAPQKESFLSVFAVPISRAEADELQSVSAKYQTSFRENISDAERLENLEKIQSELNKFNEQLVEKKQLFSYAVRSSFYVNGTRRPDTDNHHYPNSYKDDIEWRYTIQRIYKNPGESNEEVKIKESSSLSIEHYLKATQLCTNMLTKAYKELPTRKKPSLTDVLRKYSEVGKIRLEKWNELENPPRIY